MIKFNPRLLCFLCLQLTGYASFGQALTLLDNFSRADGPTVGNGWVETESVGPSSAALVGGQLKLSNGSAAGRDFVTRDLSANYAPILHNNAGRLTWAWNVRQSRTNPSGFDGSNYGVAFVLAASSANLTAAATTGYAVVVGNANTPDPFRLVRFAGGLTRNANLTNVFATNTDYGTAYLTLRVTYLPDDDSWTLAVTPNTAGFDDPGTATTFQTIGTGVDATYTTTALPYLGCLWNHAATASEAALFDNIYVTAPCAVGPEPTAGPGAGGADQLTPASARLGFAAGNGSGRVVVLRAGAAPTGGPVDGTAYAASPAFGSGAPVASGAYVVYNGAGTSVSVTNLQANTAYFYDVYEVQGTGCAANYYQAAPLRGTFSTPPCAPAAAPAVSAAQGTATAAAGGTGSLTFGWQPGDGTRRLVVVRPAQAVAAVPADATDYAANARYGLGAALGADEYAVYDGPGSSVTVTGLTVGATYYAAVYEATGSGCTAAYRTVTPATASAAVPAPPAATTYRFYRGNLHAHSGYSDGNKDATTSGASTPADDYALARQAQQFDFLGLSEHNHSQAGMSLPNYARGVQQAVAATQDGSFVALYGMEYGTISGGGHVIIYGYDKLLGWEAGNYDVYVTKGDYTALFATLAQQPGAVAYLAHPQATDYNNLFATPYNATTGQVLVGSALRSGPAFSTNTTYTDPSSSSFEARFQDALKLGYHVAPTLDHDSHYSVFGRSTPGRLVLLAPALTRAALLDALQQRRFYAADDYNAEVSFQVGTRPMGSVVTQAGAPTLRVAVADPDANDAVASIALFAGVPGSGTAAALLTSSTGSPTLSYTDPIPDQATYYYYAVITQADGDKFWTAPIRYTRNNAQPLPVALVRFRATLQNAQEAVLRWTTATERNSAYFAVERSRDGQTFAEAGRVAAAGASTQARTYEWRDPAPLTGRTYYRLRQVDTDQRTAFSPVETLTPGAREAAQAHVYPNPSVGRTVTRLALRGLAQEPVTVQVVDAVGRVVATQQVVPSAYQVDVPLSLPATLPGGIYAVSVRSSARVWTSRLLVE